MPDARSVLDLPDGLPPWLAAFVLEAQRETDTLCDNGAEQAAAARVALLRKLITAAAAQLDEEIDIHEAAREKGVCEETIRRAVREGRVPDRRANPKGLAPRSEEHTSELQSQSNLVCRLLLEKKKKKKRHMKKLM